MAIEYSYLISLVGKNVEIVLASGDIVVGKMTCADIHMNYDQCHVFLSDGPIYKLVNIERITELK